MGSTLFLDFETKDYGISQGLGAGWPYKNKVKVIGYSFAFDSRPVYWREGTKDLEDVVDMSDTIVCHNAQYDVGILRMLGVNYNSKLIIDTMLQAKLHNNTLQFFNLNYLGKEFLNETKSEEAFADIARELKLVKSKSQDAVKYAKENLDVVYAKYPEIVAEYANQDVALTRKLYHIFHDSLVDVDYTFYSDLIKAVINTRAAGVRVDVARIYRSLEILEPELFKVNQTLSKYLQGLNPNSTRQLASVCDAIGVKYPVTDKGNPSITSKWIEDQDGEFFDALKQYKKLNKIKTDFLEKTINLVAEVEGVLPSEVANLSTSRIHPEINIFGATATGRFSGSNPNVQQQPKRDEYTKPLVRSLFLPEEGESWYCLDFSAQEPRLQVHYAARINSSSGLTMAAEWRQSPDYDMHQYVADMVGIGRTQAKTINLGLAYGMGATKLSRALKASIPEAKSLISEYHEGAPYLNDLIKATKNKILATGYITTLLGRKLYKDASAYDDNGRIQDFSYKAINKLIQGSAADQTMAAMVLAYRHGITITFPVHDELTLSASSALTVAKLKYIMENSVALLVPSKSEVTGGPDFATQENVDLILTDEEQTVYDNFIKDFKPIK